MSSAQRTVLGLVAGLAVGFLVFTLRARGPAGLPGTAAPASASPFRFADVTKESGIAFVHDNGRTGRYLYPENMGAGLALFDAEGDGDLDVFLVNGNALAGAPDPKVRSAFFINEGNGRFRDATDTSGLGVVGYGQGACVGDVDGDGRLDLFVSMLGESRFFRNRGDGAFEDQTKKAGLGNDGWGQSCGFLDYDGDGSLDLYVLNYLTYSVDMPQEQLVVRGGRKVQDYIGPFAFQGAASRLYRNRGDGTFEDATRKAGLFRTDGKGMGLATVDFDGDGRTDIFQANDGVVDFLFHNRGGGRFEEIGLMAGVAVGDNGNPKASMGVDVGDFDHDADLDIVIPTVRQEVYSLYRNDGALSFADASWTSGMAEATGQLTGFSGHFGDFDNDGDLDLFFTNGEVKSHDTVPPDAPDQARYGTPSIVLANEGGRFVDVSKGAGPYFERAFIGRGAAAGDLDNDGAIDLVVSNCGGPATVLRNETKGGHWITLVLRDSGKNWEAIGAQVWLEAGGKTQYREVHGSGGYLSTNDRRLHFGLGAAAQADTIEIRWPSGERETRTALSADRIVTITRGR
jgi:hypothetical protein